MTHHIEDAYTQLIAKKAEDLLGIIYGSFDESKDINPREFGDLYLLAVAEQKRELDKVHAAAWALLPPEYQEAVEAGRIPRSLDGPSQNPV